MPFAEIDDATLYYKVRGEGSPVIGIMGFGLDQRFWAGQIPTITATNSFVTFDNRGTGRSSGSLVTDIASMAGDVCSLMDHLGYSEAIVMGVSMGGAIAQRVALDQGARVSGLVLAMTWARPIEFMRRQNAVARRLVECGGPAALLEASIVRMFTPRFFEIGSNAIDQMLRAISGDATGSAAAIDALNAQLEAIENHDTLADLSSIRCPTLVAAGRMDMIVPFFASEEIAAAIPGAEFVEFNTGHGMLVEEMDAFNTALAKFLASVNGRSLR
jgi:aminoacrylate hydrolase